MSPRPPAVVIVTRALIVLAIESALLAWGLGGVGALLASPRAWALIAIWGVVGVTLGFARIMAGFLLVMDIVHRGAARPPRRSSTIAATCSRPGSSART